MAWKQLKPFDQNKAGKEPGMCLKNTRLGYGIASKYANAWTAWLNTEQHTGRDYPAGVDVPIYFWYINANNGHIGVRLANGKFWTDGRIFDSVEAYEAAKVPNYVGWGERINEVRVIEYVPDPPKPATPTAFRVKPGHTFRVYEPGTTNVRGTIDHSWGWYEIRGTDPKYPNRWLIHSEKYGKPTAFPFANTAGQSYMHELETK